MKAGGGVLATTAKVGQAFDKWLDENPLLKAAISNMGGIAGGALLLRTLIAEGGPAAILSVLAVDYAYQLMLDNIDFSTAQGRLSNYLQTKDKDLTQEQADYVARKSIQGMQELGRLAFHNVASRVYRGLKKFKERGLKMDSKGYKEVGSGIVVMQIAKAGGVSSTFGRETSGVYRDSSVDGNETAKGSLLNRQVKLS